MTSHLAARQLENRFRKVALQDTMLNRFASKAFLAGRRFASTEATKAKPAGPSFAARIQGITDPLMYYGRVGLSFVTQVASHQRVGAFPNLAEAQDGIAKFFLALQNGAWKKVTVRQVGQLTAEGVKVYGFFLVGEMVGRGSIVGYNIAGCV
nr:hypothetical protein HK105_002974 [Polyrhizophydium stewartii]